MRKIFFKTSLFVLLLTFGTKDLLGNILPTRNEFTKSINKEFEVAADGDVSIHNRHGKLTINTWDKNRVKVDVTITVKAKNETTAQKVFDRIQINFSNSQDYVNAETTIESQQNSWSWWGSGNSHDYRIDYEVYMPKSCNLEAKNKYGNTFIQSLQSSAQVYVAYGDISMDGVKDKLKLKLSYGNATIANSGEVDLEIKHSKIRLKKIEDISLQSKYSTITIEEAKDIKSTSKYDNYHFGSIDDFTNQGKYDNIDIDIADNLTVFTKYTDLQVKQIEKSCNFDFSYGGVKVERMGENFSEIIITGAYADFKFGVPSSVNYKLDVHGKYAGIRYPSDLDVHYEKDKGSSHEIEAYNGGKMASSLIKARLKYGGFKLIKL